MWPKRVSETRWYADPLSSNVLNNNTTTGWATGQAIIYPMMFYAAGTVKAVGVYKTNASVRTGLVFRPAILSPHTDGKPGAVITDYGDLNMGTASAGVISINGDAVIPSAGMYYIGLKYDNGGSAGTIPTMLKHGTAIKTGAVYAPGYSGTLANDFPGTTLNGDDFWPFNYTGIATGAWGSMAGVAHTTTRNFNVLLGIKFTPNPDGGPGWAWHGADARWQVIA